MWIFTSYKKKCLLNWKAKNSPIFKSKDFHEKMSLNISISWTDHYSHEYLETACQVTKFCFKKRGLKKNTDNFF